MNEIRVNANTLNLNLKAVGKCTPRSTTLHNCVQLLEAFAKLRKATISFVMLVAVSVCPSVRVSARMEQRNSHWTYFLEIWYSCIFREYVEEIQVSLKSDKHKEYFT
jgi:hypothetical protein